MSGAEAALLGVGILCNAMQILTFAKDSIHIYRNVRDGRAPDPKLYTYLKNAKACYKELNQIAAQTGPLGHTQQQIVDVGGKVNDCVDELQQQFAKLSVEEPSTRLAASKKSAMALWRGKELQAAENKLQRYEQLLHSLLLYRVCSQSQAAEITSLQAFQNLGGTLQNIILQVVDGSTKISDLVIDFSTDVRNRIADAHLSTRTIIEDNLTSTENAISQTISQSIHQLRQELIERENDKALEKQYEQLLSSLRFPEMNNRKNHISNNYPGTFDWIYDRQESPQSDYGSSPESDLSDMDRQLSEDTHGSDTDATSSTKSTNEPGFDNFAGWLESHSNVFWVSGKPASGKSSLMKLLAFNHLTSDRLKKWQPNVRILAHFFWKPGQLLERNVEGMVLSLLYQVLHGHLDIFRKLYSAQPALKHKRSHSDWSLEELTEALIWALETSSEAFCIFLDGLDEAKELEDLPWPDWTNAHVIHRLLKVDGVKLCASSREERVFCSFFKGVSRLKMEQFNKSDITLFVRQRLDICGLECRDRDELVQETVERAEGVFLWVALMVNRLNRAIRQDYTTIEMLQERLRQAPSDLNILYADMWSRIGDDAKLPSIQMTASRYFNLLIIARELDEYLSKDSLYSHPASMRMSSLLVMAIAAQDQSIETILSTGRVITIEELLLMSSRAHNELKWACRGLLEVANSCENSSHLCNEDERLRECNSKRVDFVHRSAFDFLIDTEAGRECLHAYGSSRSETASKLVAGHLIRARFIELNRSLYSLSDEVHGKPLYGLQIRNNYLPMAIAISFHPRLFTETSVREDLFDSLREWQLSGLFSGHKCFTRRTSFHYSSNCLELEFIEASILMALHDIVVRDCSVEMKRLFDKHPGSLFIDAIPTMLGAFVKVRGDPLYSDVFVETFRYILKRLQSIATEEAQHRCKVRDSILVLHSWYITFCLGDLCLPGRARMLAASSAMDLLGELRDTLLLEEDWDHPLLLEFHYNHGPERLSVLLQQHGCYTTHGQVAVVVGNFATAHRLLDEDFLQRSWGILDIQMPKGVNLRFDVILIADVDINRENIHCYVPETRFHNQIERFLRLRLHESEPEWIRRSWHSVLQCSDTELGPIDASGASKYVIQALKERGVDLLAQDSIVVGHYLQK